MFFLLKSNRRIKWVGGEVKTVLIGYFMKVDRPKERPTDKQTKGQTNRLAGKSIELILVHEISGNYHLLPFC